MRARTCCMVESGEKSSRSLFSTTIIGPIVYSACNYRLVCTQQHQSTSSQHCVDYQCDVEQEWDVCRSEGQGQLNDRANEAAKKRDSDAGDKMCRAFLYRVYKFLSRRPLQYSDLLTSLNPLIEMIVWKEFHECRSLLERPAALLEKGWSLYNDNFVTNPKKYILEEPGEMIKAHFNSSVAQAKLFSNIDFNDKTNVVRFKTLKLRRTAELRQTLYPSENTKLADVNALMQYLMSQKVDQPKVGNKFSIFGDALDHANVIDMIHRHVQHAVLQMKSIWLTPSSIKEIREKGLPPFDRYEAPINEIPLLLPGLREDHMDADCTLLITNGRAPEGRSSQLTCS